MLFCCETVALQKSELVNKVLVLLFVTFLKAYDVGVVSLNDSDNMSDTAHVLTFFAENVKGHDSDGCIRVADRIGGVLADICKIKIYGKLCVILGREGCFCKVLDGKRREVFVLSNENKLITDNTYLVLVVFKGCKNFLTFFSGLWLRLVFPNPVILRDLFDPVVGP